MVSGDTVTVRASRAVILGSGGILVLLGGFLMWVVRTSPLVASAIAVLVVGPGLLILVYGGVPVPRWR